MRWLFCALIFYAACDDTIKTPAQQCMDGAKSVDGETCCGAIALGQVSQFCSDGDHCIGEPGVSCLCSASKWVCGDPPIRDLSMPDLSPRD
jgi:hypothetical protein